MLKNPVLSKFQIPRTSSNLVSEKSLNTKIRLLPMNSLSLFHHFVGLEFKMVKKFSHLTLYLS